MSESNTKNKPSAEDIEKLLESGKTIFLYIQQQSNNHFISPDKANEIFNMVNSDSMYMFYENKEKLIDGIKFYTKINTKINKIDDIKKLSETIKFFFITNENSEHMQNEFNVVQYLMKICTHRIWQLCYKLYPRVTNNPKKPTKENVIKISQENFAELLEILKE